MPTGTTRLVGRPGGAEAGWQLTLDEFSQGVAMMGIRPVPLPGDMRALFEAYDKDGDGWIEWHELEQMFGPAEPARTGEMTAAVKAALAGGGAT